MDVELDGFVRRLVFFLDGLIVGDDHQRVFVFFRVGLRERDLNGADVRRGLRLGQVQLEDIALAGALQLVEFFLVARDQSALHAQVAHRAGEFRLGGFQVLLGRGDVAFRAGQIRAHRSDLGVRVLLHLSDLRGQFVVGFLLRLADVLGQRARLRQFGLRESEFLRGHFQLALQIGHARIHLIDLHGQDLLLWSWPATAAFSSAVRAALPA